MTTATGDDAGPPSDPLPADALSVCLPPDGRQSEAALAVARGAGRVLRAHGLAWVPELALANGRRADLAAVTPDGDVWIVEVKSCLADFRSDQKWPEYRAFCDRLYFAVAPDFPADVIPEAAGLIVADRYGGEIVRHPPDARLSSARRKAMLVRVARAAAVRLAAAIDPDPEARALAASV